MRPPKVTLTPEQKAAAEADAKARQLQLEAYDRSLTKMTHRQLRGELRRAVKSEYAGKPPEPQAGLKIAFATILSAVLDNTGSWDHRLRPDQRNPNSSKRMCPIG
jgi:hypothetical protein